MAISPAIDTAYVVTLYGGTPWGFRLEGGLETQEPIQVSKVNPNSKSFREGVQVGHLVCRINGELTYGLSLTDAQSLVKQAGNTLELELKRADESGAVADEKIKSKKQEEEQFTTAPSSPSKTDQSKTISPETRSSEGEMPRSSARIQLISSAGSGYVSQDEEALSDTVRRRPKMNIISGRSRSSRSQIPPQSTTQLQTQTSLDATISTTQEHFLNNDASMYTRHHVSRRVRSEPTSPVRGARIKIGRASTLKDSSTPPRSSSPAKISIPSLVGRRDPIKITPPARTQSLNRSRSTWRQSSPTKQLDEQVSSIMNHQSERGRRTPIQIHTPVRSPSPNRGPKSVWKQNAATQPLDDQVAQITRELEALAHNMDRIIFSPVNAPEKNIFSPSCAQERNVFSPSNAQERNVTFSQRNAPERNMFSPSNAQQKNIFSPNVRSPERVFSPPHQPTQPYSPESPPRLVSPPSGLGGKAYKPVSFNPASRQGSTISTRSDSPSSLASSGMTINVDSLLSTDPRLSNLAPSHQQEVGPHPPCPTEDVIAPSVATSEKSSPGGYSLNQPWQQAPPTSSQTTTSPQQISGVGSRGHSMFMRQKQKLRETDDEFNVQTQQLQQQKYQQDYNLQKQQHEQDNSLPVQKQPYDHRFPVQPDHKFQKHQHQQDYRLPERNQKRKVIEEPMTLSTRQSALQHSEALQNYHKLPSKRPTSSSQLNTSSAAGEKERLEGLEALAQFASMYAKEFDKKPHEQKHPHSHYLHSQPKFTPETALKPSAPIQLLPSYSPPSVHVHQHSLQLNRLSTPGNDRSDIDGHSPSVKPSIQVINRSPPTKPNTPQRSAPSRTASNPSSTPRAPAGPPRPATAPKPAWSAPSTPSKPAWNCAEESKLAWNRTEELKNVGLMAVRSVSPAPMARREAPSGPNTIQVESSVTSPSHEDRLTNGEGGRDYVNGIVNGSHSQKSGLWDQDSNAGDILSDIEETTKRVRQTAQQSSNDVDMWTPGSGQYVVNQKQFRSIKLDPNNGDVIVKSEVHEKNKSALQHNNDDNDVISLKQMNGHPVVTSAHNQPINNEKLHLPKTQSPAVTILQKYREGHIPKGAIHLGTHETVDGDVTHQDTLYLLSSKDKHITSQTIEHKAPKYDGIGPKEERTGVPTGLRSTIDEKNQKDWYKEFYKTLHVSDKPKEVNSYRPTYTFPEPEPELSRIEEENPYVPRFAQLSPRYRESQSRLESDVNGNDDDDDNEGTLTRTRANNNNTESKSANWLPAHAKSKLEKYRNQPRRIEDYEPGKSSLASQEKRTSTLYNPPIEKPGENSQYTINEKRVHVVPHRTTSATSAVTNNSQSTAAAAATSDPHIQHQWYKQVQRGGEIPTAGFRRPAPERKDDVDDVFVTDYRPKSAAERLGVKTPPPFNIKGVQGPRHHFSTSDIPTRGSPAVTLERQQSLDRHQHQQHQPVDRRRRDEEDARRKHYLNILNEENKRKRAEEERRSLEQRRHNDYFLPKQKSPIPEDRFDGVQPPRLDKKHKPLEVKGKAKAIYSFRAQNIKELSFRKGDVIYLLRQIDANWYEAERHGLRGIVPVNYIEVLKSIEEAHSMAQIMEGTASMKYRFRKQNPIELDADKGAVVQLVRRVDENWYEARLQGLQGIIPTSYLNISREPDTPFITPAPSVVQSAIHSTVTTPGPGTPVRPLSPLVPDPLSPPEWDFTKFYLPGMNRSDSREQTLKAGRKHNTLPRDFISPETVGRDYSAAPPPGGRNRYHSESSLAHDRSYGSDRIEDRLGDGYDSRYSTLDSRKSGSTGEDWRRRDMMDGVPPQPRHGMEGVPPQPRHGMEGGPPQPRHDEPLKAFRVVFNYNPQNEDELDIKEGDHVYVLEQCDDGWFVGTSTRTGQFGTFPGNYVVPV